MPDALTERRAALRAAFERAFPGQTPSLLVRAPGRVNLLGGHVDMHGGPVINVAVDREIRLAAAPTRDGEAHLVALNLGEEVRLRWDRLEARQSADGDPLPHWALYPAGIAWALRRRGPITGLQAVFLGDLPMGGGLSSSAAVEAAFALAWQSLTGVDWSRAQLAQAGHEAERDYVQIGTGIQDQFTSLHARAGHALWLDCQTLEHRHVRLPPDVTVVVCDTGTRRALVGSGYRARAEAAHGAVQALRGAGLRVERLTEVAPEQLEQHRDHLTPGQYARARHVITEIARVAQGLVALERGDAAEFGELMLASYRSARDDYGSSAPALDDMVAAAVAHPGCCGARYSGGGEAGAVVALVRRGAVADFVATVGEQYARGSGRVGSLFAVEPAEGAGLFGGEQISGGSAQQPTI